MSNSRPLRIATLGTARITPMALLRPAREVAEVTVVAVAARDPTRATKFAAKHGIPCIHRTYAALVADPNVDAVYNPLPNALHCEWTIKALEAGKHVLCEKPMASHADEALQMAEAAEKAGRVLVEGLHWRTHPLAARMKEIVEGGELGDIQHLEANLCIPYLVPGDIRYRYDLAGGATMDVGCYAISIVRHLAGAEPHVVAAEARLASPHVDRYMRAEFRFADGRTGRIICSLFSARLLQMSAQVVGSDGRLVILNPIAPHAFHRLTVRTKNGKRSERVRGESTYTHQLRSFVRSVRGDESELPDAHDAVANMRVIDAIYEKAGLKRRGC